MRISTVGDPSIEKYKTKYCIEQDILDRLDRSRRASKNAEAASYAEERIDYILRTGANWSGPIKDFRLIVDKGNPNNLVTFCGDGVKKVSPTQFELRKTNFTPQGNFSAASRFRADPALERRFLADAIRCIPNRRETGPSGSTSRRRISCPLPRWRSAAAAQRPRR